MITHDQAVLLGTVGLDQTGNYSVQVRPDAGLVSSREARLDVGVVRAWGGGRWASHPNYSSGLTNVVAVAAAFVESIALRADGTVIAWADDNNNPIYESAGLTNIISISAGRYGSAPSSWL